MEAEFNYQFTVEKMKVGGTRSRWYVLEPSEDMDTKHFGSVSSSEWWCRIILYFVNYVLNKH